MANISLEPPVALASIGPMASARFEMAQNALLQEAPTVLFKTIPLRGYTISQKEIQDILRRLEATVHEFGRGEIDAFVKPHEVAQEKWDHDKAEYFNAAFKVTTNVNGSAGDSVYAPTIDTVFTENTPRRVGSVYSTNRTTYRGFTGREPPNQFEINLDFNVPPVLATHPVSDPTPNASQLLIRGTSAWVASAESAVFDILRDHKNTRSFLHKAFIYDFGVLFLAIPLALAIAYYLSPHIDMFAEGVHPIVLAAIYIYFFYCSILVYRVCFGYAKWMFPTMELTGRYNPTEKHRKFWMWLLGGLLLVFLGWLLLPD